MVERNFDPLIPLSAIHIYPPRSHSHLLNADMAPRAATPRQVTPASPETMVQIWSQPTRLEGSVEQSDPSVPSRANASGSAWREGRRVRSCQNLWCSTFAN